MTDRQLFICVVIVTSTVLVLWKYIRGKRIGTDGDQPDQLAQITFGLLNPTFETLRKSAKKIGEGFAMCAALSTTSFHYLFSPIRPKPANFPSPLDMSRSMFRVFISVFIALTLLNRLGLIELGVPQHYEAEKTNGPLVELLTLSAELLLLMRYLVGLILIGLLGVAWQRMGIIKSDRFSELSDHLIYYYNSLFFVFTISSLVILLCYGGFDGTEKPARESFAVGVGIFTLSHSCWTFNRIRVEYGNTNPLFGWLVVGATSFIAATLLYVLWLLGIVVFTLV